MSKFKRKAYISNQGKLLSTSACCATLALSLTTALPNVAHAQTFDIQSATANAAHRDFPASNAIDGDTSFQSRWAGNLNPEQLILDLGTNRTVDDVQIAWGRGDSIVYRFTIEGRSGTSGSWTEIFDGQSSGDTADFENYNVNDISARQIRVTGLNSRFTNLSEIRIIGTGGPGPSPSPAPSPSTSPSGVLNIVGATSTGGHPNFPPENAIDGNTSFRSRWAGQANPERLSVDLGSD